jgi:RHS repeat-associated protein
VESDPQGKDRLVDRDLNGNSDGTDYTWIDPDGVLGQDVLTTTTIFDENDKAVGTESRLDGVLQSSTTTNYDSLGRPWQTIDANGLKTENLYDKRGLVIQTRSETLNTGTNPATSQVERIWNVSRTVYDEQGRAVISVSGMTQYASETVTLITAVGEITGSRSNYNTKGQLASSEQLRGVNVQITGTAPNLTSVLGNVPTIVSTSSTTYDADNRVTQTTDAFGKISQSYYDRWGNVVESRTQTKNETGTPLWMVTRSVFDATGRLVATTDPYTVPSSTPLGKPGGNSPAVFGTFTLYDSRGRSVGSERRSNVVTGWSSDTDRILSAIVSSGTLVSATSTVYNAQGRPSKQIGADGQVSITEYDARGRTVASLGMHVLAASVGLPNRGSQNAVRLRTETEYNALGQAHKTISNVIEYGTIVSGQFVKSTDPLDVIRTNQRVTEQVFNAKGQVIKTIYPDGTNTQQEFDVLGRVTAEIDQLGNRKDMTYNAAGQLTQIQLPSVPNPLASNTPTRPTFLYEYNAAGQMTKLTDSNNRVTNFGFNALNQSTSRTLPLGNQETFSYDLRGRQLLQVTFEGIYVRMVYDDSATGGGRLSEKQFFDNAVVYNNGSGTPTERLVYSYDAFGRIVQQQHIRPTVTDPYTTAYDVQGRVTQETTPTGFINYEYDLLGRKTKTLSGTTLPTVLSDVTYTYDLLGRLSTVNTVKRDGAIVDSNGAGAGTPPESTAYFYDLLGRPDYTLLPNGVIEDYTFDAMDRMELMAHRRASDNAVLASYDYTYRADGKRTGLNESFATTTARSNSYTWSYDNAGRLISEVLDSSDNSVDQTESYVYDLVGNRMRKEVNKPATAYVDQVFAYNYDANDRITSETLDNGANGTGVDSTTTYGWTQTQQTSKTVSVPSVSSVVQSMSYGLGGQLERVVTTTQNGSGTVTGRTRVDYRYTPQGIRTISVDWTDANLDGTFAAGERTGSIEYLIDNANFTGYQQTILETVKNAAGQATKRTSYTFGVDEITQTTTLPLPGGGEGWGEGETLTFAHDGKGSVRALFGAAAAIAQVFTYSAYGELLAIHNGSGLLTPNTSSLTAYLYNGEGFDTRTGLYNMRARWYSASSARWERLDPFNGNPTDPFSFNKYGFVHGDPIRNTDPTGEWSLGGFAMSMAIGGLVGGFGGAAVGGAYGAIKYRSFSAAAQHALLGAMMGAAIGSSIGGATYALAAGISGLTGAAATESLKAASIIVAQPLRAAAIFQTADGMNREDGVDTAFGALGIITAYTGVFGYTPWGVAVRFLPYTLRRAVFWRTVNIRQASQRGISQELDEVGVGGMIENKDARGLDGRTRAEIDAWVERKVFKPAQDKMRISSAPDLEVVNSEASWLPAPTVQDIAMSRALQYRFMSKDINLKASVADALNRLSKLFPDWELSAEFGVYAKD